MRGKWALWSIHTNFFLNYFLTIFATIFKAQEWVVCPFFAILVHTHMWISTILSTIAIAIKNSWEKSWCEWTIKHQYLQHLRQTTVMMTLFHVFIALSPEHGHRHICHHFRRCIYYSWTFKVVQPAGKISDLTRAKAKALYPDPP